MLRIGKPKNSLDSFYCDLCLILVVWNQTLNISEIYLYYIFLIYSSINRHLDCFHILATVWNVAKNIIYLFKLYSLYGYSLYGYPAVELLEHTGNCIFIFLRKFHTSFHRGCTNLHSYQEGTRVSFFHILTNTYLLYFG